MPKKKKGKDKEKGASPAGGTDENASPGKLSETNDEEVYYLKIQVDRMKGTISRLETEKDALMALQTRLADEKSEKQDLYQHFLSEMAKKNRDILDFRKNLRDMEKEKADKEREFERRLNDMASEKQEMKQNYEKELKVLRDKLESFEHFEKIKMDIEGKVEQLENEKNVLAEEKQKRINELERQHNRMMLKMESRFKKELEDQKAADEKKAEVVFSPEVANENTDWRKELKEKTRIMTEIGERNEILLRDLKKCKQENDLMRQQEEEMKSLLSVRKRDLKKVTARLKKTQEDNAGLLLTQSTQPDMKKITNMTTEMISMKSHIEKLEQDLRACDKSLEERETEMRILKDRHEKVLSRHSEATTILMQGLDETDEQLTSPLKTLPEQGLATPQLESPLRNVGTLQNREAAHTRREYILRYLTSRLLRHAVSKEKKRRESKSVKLPLIGKSEK